MTCREVAEFLADYVARELPPDIHAKFDRHFSRCANCQRFLAQYVDTIAAGKIAFGDPDADADRLPEELLAAILDSRP